MKSVAFSPNGELILSSSKDKSIKLWHIKNYKIDVKNYFGHTGTVNSVVFSPTGNFFASCSNDRRIIFWDVTKSAKTAIINNFEADKKKVSCLNFSYDGFLLCSGSTDGTIKIWNVDSGDLITTFKKKVYLNQANCCNSCSFSRDSSVILSCFSDSTVKLWEIKTGNILKTFEEHSGEVYSVCFSPDEKLIVSTSVDKTMKFWDNSISLLLKQYQGHAEKIRCLAFSTDGSYLLSGSRDKKIKMWEADSGNFIKCFEGHKDFVTSLSFSPDGRNFLSGSGDGSVYLWNIDTGNIEKTVSKHDLIVNSVGFLEKSIFFSTSSNVFLGEKSFETETNEIIKFVAFSQCGSKFIAGYYDKTIKLWDSEYFNLLQIYNEPKKGQYKGPVGHTKTLKCGCFPHNENTFFITGSKDRTIKLWGINETNFPLMSFEGHTKSVNCVAFSINDELIFSGSSDKTIKVWETLSGFLLQSLEGHFMKVTTLAIHPIGKGFASGSKDKSIKLWEKIENETNSRKKLSQRFPQAFPKRENNYFCKVTIAPNETPLNCEGMIIVDCNEYDVKVFLEKGGRKFSYI